MLLARLSLLPVLFFAVACSAPSAAPGANGASPGTPDPGTGVPIHANPGESQVSISIPKDPATQLVVGVDAEDFAAIGFQATALEVTVRVDGVVAAHESLDAEAGALFPHALRVVAPKDKKDAAVVVSVAVRSRGVDVLTRTATTRFVPRGTRLAYLFLESRCAAVALGGGGGPPGPACTTAGQTCIGGVCASDTLGDLPDVTADWPTNPPSACGAGGPSELLVGRGQNDFTALASGDTLTPECGPQGGHHIWMALRMKNIGQFGSKTVLSATQPGGTAQVPLTGYAYPWAPAGAGQCQLVGVRLQLDVGVARIDQFLGKPLDITATTSDKSGRQSTAVSHVRIAAAPVGPFCP